MQIHHQNSAGMSLGIFAACSKRTVYEVCCLFKTQCMNHPLQTHQDLVQQQISTDSAPTRGLKSTCE